MKAIQEACTALESGYQPAITFIVVQKRHHARFFPQNREEAVRIYFLATVGSSNSPMLEFGNYFFDIIDVY